MELIFVHGWSVRNTSTYCDLPARLAREFSVGHIYLGKYVSFNDEVTLDDLTRAFDAAVREKGLTDFACITHSTGGPLLRNWLLKYARQNEANLTHLIMLAPANHGSALAQLGKGRLSRLKAFFESVEPGQRILDWLELGSESQWAQNIEWLDFKPSKTFPFVLAGQSIDRKLYDHLNSYTGEAGSDGVVRVAAANLNYEFIRLVQNAKAALKPVLVKRSQISPLAILAGVSHGGTAMGIMAGGPALPAILKCLAVQNEANYEDLALAFEKQNEANLYSMVIFRVIDDHGEAIDDYDLLFTAGPEASPDLLPEGFFRDRQRNHKNPGKLTYYLNYERLQDTPIGFELTARPDSGLVHFEKAVIIPQNLGTILRPGETLMVEVVLRRIVDRNCFRLTENLEPEAI